MDACLDGKNDGRCGRLRRDGGWTLVDLNRDSRRWLVRALASDFPVMVMYSGGKGDGNGLDGKNRAQQHGRWQGQWLKASLNHEEGFDSKRGSSGIFSEEIYARRHLLSMKRLYGLVTMVKVDRWLLYKPSSWSMVDRSLQNLC